MSMTRDQNVPAWGTLTDGKLSKATLATTYGAGFRLTPGFDGQATSALVTVALAGTTRPDTVEVRWRYYAEGILRRPIPVLNSVASNVANQGPGEFQQASLGADSPDEISFWIQIPPGVEGYLEMKRTAGSVNTTASAVVDFFKCGGC